MAEDRSINLEDTEKSSEQRATSVGRCAHVDFGAETEMRRSAGFVEVEDHTLTLAHHPKDRTAQGIGREFVVGKVGIAHDETVSGCWVVCLDHALHGGVPLVSVPFVPVRVARNIRTLPTIGSAGLDDLAGLDATGADVDALS